MSTQETFPAKNLFQKMSAVMGAISRVEKNGKVGSGNRGYSYMSKDDIYSAVRKEMANVGLSIFPMIVSTEQTPVTSSNGASGLHTIVHLNIILACEDTGQTMECSYIGESTDYGDKGVAQATSIAIKYFLIGAFLISDGEDDAESSGSVETKITPKKPTSNTRPDWDENLQKRFYNYWNKDKEISKDDILATLGVSGLGEWQHSAKAANERMELEYNKDGN